MQVTTIEGIVKNGKIHLSEDVNLPESARVYVIVPDLQRQRARIMSPRLVDKSKMKDFEREIIEVDEDDQL
ncbi:MAG: hypothetical protein IT174_11690 [Acidobacteria bacterium]|nr:hypothetical protein [Acidobacteriota bacterium]